MPSVAPLAGRCTAYGSRRMASQCCPLGDASSFGYRVLVSRQTHSIEVVLYGRPC